MSVGVDEKVTDCDSKTDYVYGGMNDIVYLASLIATSACHEHGLGYGFGIYFYSFDRVRASLIVGKLPNNDKLRHSAFTLCCLL